MASPKVWFITGASTGFGLTMTKCVLKNGDIAVATLRSPSDLDALRAEHPSPETLLIIKLDVTKPEEISSAFNEVKEKLGRIDYVFNNAGYAVVGEVEGVKEADARAMFEVNFWGAMNVAKEALEFFREVNKPRGGCLLTNSSTVGLVAKPPTGWYTASKHALEGATETLAMEIDPEWNIKICLLEFGAFQTGGIRSVVLTPPHPSYTNPNLPTNIIRRLYKDFPLSGDPEKGIDFVYEYFTTTPEPPLRLPIGLDAIKNVRGKIESLTRDVDNAEVVTKDRDLTIGN